MSNTSLPSLESPFSTSPALRRETGVPVQDGPVLLATKPYNGLDATLAVARWLAAREERELRIVTVIERHDVIAGAAGMPTLPERSLAEDRVALAAQMRRELTLDGTGDDVAHLDVLDGATAPAIVEAARGIGARVIVIGTGKHDVVNRIVYGERALEILSLTDRPVLVVPRDARTGTVTVAVAAVDFSAASLRAVRTVLPMLSEGSRLVLLHVPTTIGVARSADGWWDAAYTRRCTALFRRFLHALPSLPNVVIETRLASGDVATAVLAAAADEKAGLIVCGRLTHPFLERVFVGRVSSALVRHATCPVLIAPQIAGDQPAP